MDEQRGRTRGDHGFRDPRAVSRITSWSVHLLILFASLAISHVLVTRLGPQMFVFALVGLFCGTLFAIASFRNLMIPFAIWILSIAAFRFLWTVQSPVLPDLYLDRMVLIWLGVVATVKFVAERQSLKGPYALDMLILMHGLYIYVRVYTQGMAYIQPWFMSIGIPYAAYFFAKNLVDNCDRIRFLWWSMIALLAYLSFTSIAEKYKLDALIFPRSILAARDIGYAGRSIGPYAQPGVFGSAFALLIPIQLYFVATIRSVFWRLAIGVGILASLSGLYFTYTRGSWLAGAAGLACCVYLNRRSYVRFVLPSAVVIAVVALFGLGLGNDEFMKERVENDDTLGSRVGTAVTVLRVWRDYPLTGVGFFQFRRIREQYIQPVEVPLLGTIQFSQFRENAIHDIYLGPLAEDGLIGALLQIGIYALILRTFLQKFRWRFQGDHFATYMMPVFAGTLVAYLVGGFAFDYRFFSFMGTMFYLAAGILYGYRRQEPSHAS